MKPSMFTFILLLSLLFCGNTYLLGQGTDLGTIRGTITDQSGAVVPNATIVILDLGTGTPRETRTNSRGEYQVFGLKSGNYKVTVSAQGMSTVDITGIVLKGSDVIGANAVLKVSTANEQVVVTAEAPTIDTQDQTISNTISHREVIDLPRDSRDVYQFLFLNFNITKGVDSCDFKFLCLLCLGPHFTLVVQLAHKSISACVD